MSEFDSIPIVDVSPFLTQTDSKQMELSAQKIRSACVEHGFFYVSGHGVDAELIDRLDGLSRQFFALPLGEKMKISMSKGGKAWRGYFPVGEEFTSGKPDHKEGIYFGPELPENHPKVLGGIPLHGKNLFPEEPSEFGSVVLDYMDQVTSIGHTVLQGIALSLQLPIDYFDAVTQNDPFILFRIFRYPPQSKDASDWGVGEHSDYGLLTILKQDSVGGLQVKSKGGWIDAPPIPNTFICNIGDMLDRMTYGYYRSTLHRVVNRSGKERLSFPLFFDPNFDTVVKPIDGLTEHKAYSDERWDGENVYQFDGPYGKYILRKVSKVFPGLFDENIK
jgi:isopenicillin N synthase-like dioxygenase